MQLRGVQSDELDWWFPLALPWLEPVCKLHGLITPEWYLDRFKSGANQLWLVIDDKKIICVGVTEIDIYPLGNVGRLITGTGEHREKWIHYLAVLEAWAKANGCKRFKMEARPGWKKDFENLGYELTHSAFEKEI